MPTSKMRSQEIGVVINNYNRYSFVPRSWRWAPLSLFIILVKYFVSLIAPQGVATIKIDRFYYLIPIIPQWWLDSSAIEDKTVIQCLDSVTDINSPQVVFWNWSHVDFTLSL